MRYLAPEARVFVYDVRRQQAAVRALGATPAALQEACRCDAIILCVPISRFEEAIRRVGRLARPGALVVDTCSVKEHPVRVMRRLLPRGIEILATHPNFGPDSAAETLKGHKMVVCPVRLGAARYRRIRLLLERKGLDVVEMTPREHDRRMASSLVLTHFIGRALIRYGSRPTGVDTEGYKRLMRILQTVQNDTWRLFEDMNRYNAFSGPMRRKLLAAMSAVDRRVEARP